MRNNKDIEMDRKGRIENLKNEICRRMPKSGELWNKGKEIYPGGKVSAARVFDPWPFYATKGEGPYIWDVDGNKYIDCAMCFGVLLLGHRPKHVLDALAEQKQRALHYGAPIPGEIEFGEKFIKCVPCAEMVVMANTGNETVHKSIAIARAYTGKDKIGKFEGCFHGSNEYGMWSTSINPELMGPAECPNAVPMCAGMSKAARENLILLPFGENATFEMIEKYGSDMAAVILEPVLGVGGCIPFEKGYLTKLREVTQKNGVLLIFDEIVTGFRLALGGGQELFGVTPDIALFGKALGGGMPIGAIGASREILQKCVSLDPPLSLAGTFSGNAMTLAAANAMLDYLMANPQIYDQLREKGDYLRSRFNDFANDKGFPASISGIGSMFQIHMMTPPPKKPRDRLGQKKELLEEFALRLRLEGVFVPIPLHLAFISPSHSDKDIEDLLNALQRTLEACFS